MQQKLVISSLLRFFVKRVGILYGLLLIVCFLSKSQRIAMILVLTLSVFFSILRLALLEAILKILGDSGNKRLAIITNLVVYLFSLVVIGITLILAMRINFYTFIVALVGALSSVIIIMINAITEALGITRNQYGQKVK